MIDEWDEAKQGKTFMLQSKTYPLIDGSFPVKFVNKAATSDQLLWGVCINVADIRAATFFYKRIGLVEGEFAG